MFHRGAVITVLALVHMYWLNADVVCYMLWMQMHSNLTADEHILQHHFLNITSCCTSMRSTLTVHCSGLPHTSFSLVVHHNSRHNYVEMLRSWWYNCKCSICKINPGLASQAEMDRKLRLVTIANILCHLPECWQTQSDSSSVIIHMTKNSQDGDLF